VISLLLARTESHDFAFRSEDVETVLLLPRLQRQPGDIAMIEGWFCLRGLSVPVVSLSKVLGLGQEPPQLSDHLLLTSRLPRVAWRVRRVSGLGEVGWESLRLLEHSAEPAPCYAASFQWEGQSTNLINVAGLLLAEELERMQEAETRRAARLLELENETDERSREFSVKSMGEEVHGEL
jgi:chemotaxis signal transduction protein